MQRDANSDERTKTGASGRTPPVIEGEAVEIPARAESRASAETETAETVAAAQAAEEARYEAEMAGAGAESAGPESNAENDDDRNGAGQDAIAAPPAKKGRGSLLAVFGIIIVAAAGAVAWIAAPGHDPGDGSLKSRVIALLPEPAKRALHIAPPPDETSSEAKPLAPPEKSSADGAARTEAARTEGGATEASKSETAAPQPSTTEPKSAESTTAEPKSEASKAEPATTAEPKAVPPAASASGASTALQTSAGADPKLIADMSAKIDGLQSKLDAALGRIDDLQSKLELAQGRIEQTQSKTDAAATATAVTQAVQRIETLTQKLAAVEQKLEQPKTDARAPQARENAPNPSGREFAASRAVVAQATAEALRAGAPLADDLAALKGLGVADDRIADLTAYAKSGAPTIAQLTQQWRGLRDKAIALDAPPPGSSFGDKLLARARDVFHVTWAGKGAQNSISATVSRVDGALAKSDLTAALAACDDFPAVAKNLVADWRTAASARLKADAAARALLSESISAIGRSSQ